MTVALIVGAYLVGTTVGWHLCARLAGVQADMLCSCLDETSTTAETATAALGNALDERAAALVRAAIAEGHLHEARMLLHLHGIPVPTPVTVP